MHCLYQLFANSDDYMEDKWEDYYNQNHSVFHPILRTATVSNNTTLMWAVCTVQLRFVSLCFGLCPFFLNNGKFVSLSRLLYDEFGCHYWCRNWLPEMIRVKTTYHALSRMSNSANTLTGWLHFLDYLSLRPKYGLRPKISKKWSRFFSFGLSNQSLSDSLRPKFGLRTKLIRTFRITAYWFYMEEIH